MLHKTFPGTAAACAAVAVALPGSVPAAVARSASAGRCVIGHPGGAMRVWAEVREEAGAYRVVRAAYARTARRLLEGHAFVRPLRLQPEATQYGASERAPA